MHVEYPLWHPKKLEHGRIKIQQAIDSQNVAGLSLLDNSPPLKFTQTYKKFFIYSMV